MITAAASTLKPMVRPPTEFIVFMVFWLLLGLASFLFFQFNRNAALKRRVWPPFMIIIGVIFAAFLWHVTNGYSEALLFMVPAIVIISILNIRLTRFCDACGRTLHAQPFCSRPAFCKYCGTKLE
jgi:hypothetical protein